MPSETETSLSPKPIRVFLLDDHTLFREGLLRLLAGSDAFVMVGHSGDSVAAVPLILAAAPDVLILDYDLGERTALQVVPQLKAANYDGRILLVTAGLPFADTLSLIRLGVSGVFHKNESPEALQHAVTEVAAGRVVVNQRYLQATVNAEATTTLIQFTERERTTMRLLLQGLANKEIASHLNISESSVKATLQQLFSKTGVRTRSQLVLQTIEKYRDQL